MLISRARSLAAVLLIGALAFALVVFSHAGTALVVEDTLQTAPAAAVFGGKTPFRAIEAARLYKEGWVREVGLAEGGLAGEEFALGELGIERTPEHVYNRQVLERLGVPSVATRVIEGRNSNTADEVRTIARALRQSGGDRVILVTSDSHSRRVKTLWHAIVGSRPEAIVRPAPDNVFDAKHWWRDTADAWTVSREWFGLLNAWAGFPVKSEHW